MPVHENCSGSTCYFQYGNVGKKYYYPRYDQTARGKAGQKAHIQEYAIRKSIERHGGNWREEEKRSSSKQRKASSKRSPKRKTSSKRSPKRKASSKRSPKRKASSKRRKASSKRSLKIKLNF